MIAPAAPRIRKLDVHESKWIRSSQHLPSFTRCVEELVLNSLDAGATEVCVAVNMSALSMSVSDNGSVRNN